MIHAVIELGEGRVHEVMVPRIDDRRPARRARRSRRRSTPSSRRATAGCRSTRQSIDEVVGILYAKDLLPFLKDRDRARGRRSGRSCGRRSSSPRACPSTTSSTSFQRTQGPHRDRARRVRRDGRPRDDRGPARGDRRRDPGRVRRRGGDDRPALRRRARIDGRVSVDELGELFDDHDRARGRGRVRHDRRARLPPDRPDPGARATRSRSTACA